MYLEILSCILNYCQLNSEISAIGLSIWTVMNCELIKSNPPSPTNKIPSDMEKCEDPSVFGCQVMSTCDWWKDSIDYESSVEVKRSSIC